MAQEDRYLEAAMLAAEWLLNNQLTDEMDANRGRVLEFVDKAAGTRRYTRSWDTGITALALLAAHSATGQAKYLEGAKLAGEYVKSLQCLDAAQPLLYGAFRELTPQTRWLHPRDTASAAWGLLGLYLVTKDADYLRRVELCADWFLQHGLARGYPSFTWSAQEREQVSLQGAFQCGGMAFLCDLVHLTGRHSYLDRLVQPVCDRYLTHFMSADGSIRTILDADTGADLSGTNIGFTPYFHHVFAYNDDFAAIALLKAAREVPDARYLQGARRFLRWLASQQNANGSLGSPPVVSACGVSILEWSDLDETSGDGEFDAAIGRAADFLLTRQERESADSRLRGGIYGLDVEGESLDARTTMHCRSTLYALLAWLRASGTAHFRPM